MARKAKPPVEDDMFGEDEKMPEVPEVVPSRARSIGPSVIEEQSPKMNAAPEPETKASVTVAANADDNVKKIRVSGRSAMPKSQHDGVAYGHWRAGYHWPSTKQVDRDVTVPQFLELREDPNLSLVYDRRESEEAIEAHNLSLAGKDASMAEKMNELAAMETRMAKLRAELGRAKA